MSSSSDRQSTNSQPTVEVLTLGRFSVRIDGKPLTLSGKTPRRPLELLKRLAVLGPSDVPVLHITDSMWPDSEGDRAYSAFTSTLSRLRGIIGHDALSLHDGRVTLDAKVCSLDIMALEAALGRAEQALRNQDTEASDHELQEALLLYQGPFLDGEYEPPEILGVRKRLHERLLAQLRNVAVRFESTLPERAEALYRVGLQHAELDEALHQGFIRCSLSSGKAAEAIARYKQCVESFKRHLDITPSAETRALLDRLDDTQAPPPIVPRPASDVSYPKTGSERRRVTIVFVKLDSQPGHDDQLDPEDFEEGLEALESSFTELMSRHGGTVVGVERNGLGAVFGVPTANEDDPVRAARATLEFLEHASAALASMPIGGRARVCAAMDSGLVVARISEHEVPAVRIVGEPQQAVFDLVALSGAGELVAGEAAVALIAPYFDLGPPQSHGTSSSRQVIGASSIRTRFEAAARRGFTPFTGRETQLALLRDCLQQAETGRGQLVTVVGDPGVGKSRLLLEFYQCLDGEPFEVVMCRARPPGESAPYGPFADALQQLFRLNGEMMSKELHERVISGLRATDPALEPFLPAFLHILSAPGSTYELPEGLAGEELATYLSLALVALFTERARHQLLVLILEDWHWAGEASRHSLDALAAAAHSHRLLLLATSRPGWTFEPGPAGHHTLVNLQPLNRAGARAIAGACLGAQRITDDLDLHIHERADGNPFFVEELCNLLLQQGRVSIESGIATMTADASEATPPESIQAVIRARIDRLPKSNRELLRTAAVIGREFSLDLLEQIDDAPEPVQHRLEMLVNTDLIEPARLVPYPLYRFKHALTQTVAYDILTLKARRTLHEHVARAIEARDGDRSADEIEALARHFRRSGDVKRAVEYSQLAIERAASSYSLVDARRHCRETIALLDDSGLPDEWHKRFRVELSLALAEHSFFAVSNDHVDVLSAASEIAASLGDDVLLARTLYWFGRMHQGAGTFKASLEPLERCADIARQHQNNRLVALAETNIGRSMVNGLGDYVRGTALMLDNVPVLERLGEFQEAAMSRSMGGWTCATVGDFEKGLELARTALCWAETQGNRTREANSCNHLTNIHMIRGDWQEAVKFADRGMRIARAVGDHFTVGNLQVHIGYATFMAGQQARGIQGLREALGALRATGSVKNVPGALAFLAKCLALHGACEEAIELATAAEADEQQLRALPLVLLARSIAIASRSKSRWHDAEPVFARALIECEARSERPFAAKVHFYRARALWNVDRPRAQSDLERAAAAFRDMDMRWWREQAIHLAEY